MKIAQRPVYGTIALRQDSWAVRVRNVIVWQWAAVLAHVTLGLLAAGHALLYKRDPRSAFGWIALNIMLPFGGALLYFLFGINRVRSRAQVLHGSQVRRLGITAQDPIADGLSAAERSSVELARIAAVVTGRPLAPGNDVKLLCNGDEAYPQMLAAIALARATIWLTTYLFDTDAKGREFIRALEDARRRGVDVRVMLDGLGDMYAWPRASRLLRKAGVPVARFLPLRLIPPSVHINLRNHRKMLLVDNEVAFVGGMNIGGRHMLGDGTNPHATQDLQCAFRGPILGQLHAAFAQIWQFATQEVLQVPDAPAPVGIAACRAVVDGPDVNLDRLELIIASMITAAHKSVRIMTPYFLPSRDLVSAMQAAALKGVAVVVVLPERSNLRYIDWATRNLLWELLCYGVRVYYQPPPFAHTKLMLVDQAYAQIGSANLDPRSLRLNFELNVEIYDADFASRAAVYFDAQLAKSRTVTLADVDARRLPERLRDSVCWLFSPYL